MDEGRLGGFHFNNRKYGDGDLIVASTTLRAVPDFLRTLAAEDSARRRSHT